MGCGPIHKGPPATQAPTGNGASTTTEKGNGGSGSQTTTGNGGSTTEKGNGGSGSQTTTGNGGSTTEKGNGGSGSQIQSQKKYKEGCEPELCPHWNCAQWCECYDADAVYDEELCEDDGDDCDCDDFTNTGSTSDADIPTPEPTGNADLSGEGEESEANVPTPQPVLHQGESIGCYEWDRNRVPALTNADFGIQSLHSGWDGYYWDECLNKAKQAGAYYFALGMTGSPRHGGQPSGGRNACIVFDNTSPNLFGPDFKMHKKGNCCTKLDLGVQLHKNGRAPHGVCLGGWPTFVVYATGLGSVPNEPTPYDVFSFHNCAPAHFNGPPRC